MRLLHVFLTVAIGSSVSSGRPLLAAQDAKPQDAGNLLASLEAGFREAKTLYEEFTITNKESGKEERSLSVIVRVKEEKRLIEYTAPPDMVGTKFLMNSPTEIYVFLPAFGKIRRVASHAAGGFFGMTFSLEDLSFPQYLQDYSASVSADAAESVTLTLTSLEGRLPVNPKIEMIVLKSKAVPSQITFFDKTGVKARTETFGGYTQEKGVWLPTELKMVDNAKEDCWTRFVRTAVKVNEPLSDDFFAKRNLGK